MKSLKQLSFILIIILFAACQQDDIIDNSPQVFVEKIKTRNVDRQDFLELVPESFRPTVEKLFIFFPSKEMSVDAITYKTKDPQGNDILASGTIAYPRDVEIKGVIVSQHFTITRNADAPSVSMMTIETALALLGYVVVQTDYIGFGETAHLPHPYCHYESTATQGVDMLFAAREYLETINKTINNEVQVIGYSQGGSASLAFQKMAEEKFSDDIIIKKVFSGGGPNDLIATFDAMIESDYISYPFTAPYLFLGLNCGDDLNLDFSKVFKEPLLSSYESLFGNKEYTTDEINDLLNTTSVKSMLHDDVYNGGNAEFDKFKESLKKNSLIDWKPKSEIVLFHSKDDTVVPYLNSVNAYESFKEQGCTVKLVTGEGEHFDNGLNFYMLVIRDLFINSGQ